MKLDSGWQLLRKQPMSLGKFDARRDDHKAYHSRPDGHPGTAGSLLDNEPSSLEDAPESRGV
jgi:hypothetical protein